MYESHLTLGLRGTLMLCVMGLAFAGCPTPPVADGFGQPMTREEHEPLFPIIEGAHGGMDCVDCHGGSPSFNQFTCMSCHDHNEEDTAAQHLAVTGYVYEAVACYQCHPRGEAGPPGGHEQLFPIDPPAVHAEVGCSDCHLALAPGQYHRNNCAGCHTTLPDHDLTALHGDVGEYVDEERPFESVDCKTCHAESQVDALIDHGPFLIKGPEGLPVPHQQSNCLECHTENRTDKTWAADFEQKSCALCHLEPDMAETHAPVVGYDYDTPTCLTCHPDGYKISYVEHEVHFPIEAPAVHQEIGCGDCHVLGELPSVNNCRSCHEQTEEDDLAGIHVDVGEFSDGGLDGLVSADCKRCHGDAQVHRVGEHGPFLIAPEQAHHRENCLECHAEDREDKAWAADFEQKSCAACHEEPDMNDTHDGIFGYAYETSTCLTCHPDGRKETGIAHENLFPIGIGTEHDEVGCAECHLDSADASQNACRQCHEQEDDLAAIHAEVGEFAEGGLADQDSAQCKRCHAEAQVDHVDDHGPFLVWPGAPHNQQNCLECHDQARADKAWAADFEQKRCEACHLQAETNTDHSGVFGYAYETNTCLSCHPDGTSEVNLDHAAFFPIAAPAEHDEVACSDCHLSNLDPAQNGCRECHEGTRNEDLPALHGNVGEFSQGGADLDSQDCKTCHAESQVDAVADHGPFLITDGNQHFQSNCLECHRDPRADKPWAADFQQKTCLFCHQPTPTNEDHTGVAGYAYESNSCLSCHPDGTDAVNIDHEPFFPLAAPAAHEGIGCSDCHLSGTDQSLTGCRECHEGTEGDDLPAIHNEVGEFINAAAAQDSAQCKRCHADSQVDPVAQHGPFLVNNGANHFGQECLECHATFRADKPWAADFTDKSCLSCHLQTETNGIHSQVAGYSYETNTCLSCHPDGSGAVNIDHEPFFPLAAPAEHEGIGCGECHLSTTDRTVVGCRECHEGQEQQNISNIHNNVGAPNGGWGAADSNDCKLCHGDAQVDPPEQHLPFLILNQGKHQERNCQRCHEQRRAPPKDFATDFDPALISCQQCHSVNQMDDKHDEENGYISGDYPNCLMCHPDGRKE